MIRFRHASELPIADRDMTVTIEIDHGVKVKRAINAGARVPATLLTAYEEELRRAGGAPPTIADPPR